jgi:hypothetical protein
MPFAEPPPCHLDAVAVHRRHDPLDRVDVGVHDVGDVLEHVLGGELHLLDGLPVLVQRPHELVGRLLLLHVPVREADAEVDDPPTGEDVAHAAHRGAHRGNSPAFT